MEQARKTIETSISESMIEAGINADILNRGKDADVAELVIEIFRAMELARRSDHGAGVGDHPGP